MGAYVDLQLARRVLVLRRGCPGQGGVDCRVRRERWTAELVGELTTERALSRPGPLTRPVIVTLIRLCLLVVGHEVAFVAGVWVADLFAVAFLAVVFLAVAFLAVAFLAVAFLAVAFLAVAFLTVAFLAVDLAVAFADPAG
jgi:hypothetical protein